MPLGKNQGEMANQSACYSHCCMGREQLLKIHTYNNTRKPKEHIKDIRTIMEVNLPFKFWFEFKHLA